MPDTPTPAPTVAPPFLTVEHAPDRAEVLAAAHDIDFAARQIANGKRKPGMIPLEALAVLVEHARRATPSPAAPTEPLDDKLLSISKEAQESVESAISKLREIEGCEPVAAQWWGIVSMALWRAACINAEPPASPVAADIAPILATMAHNLTGVLIDIEHSGCDDVCRKTIARVRDRLASMGSASPVVQDEREAFEGYAYQQGKRDFERNEFGDYRNPFTQEPWNFWRASRAALTNKGMSNG